MIKLQTLPGFVISLLIVAFGQPARIGFLCPLAAIFGFALFFHSLPAMLAKRHRVMFAALWFAAVQFIQLSWMTSIEFQGYYILFVYGFLCLAMGCQFGFLTLCIPSSGKIPVLKVLYCASFWTLMEWSRLFLFCGFSWNPIGLALTHFTYSLQLASVFGIFGLTFWVMLTNLLCLNFLQNPTKSTILKPIVFILVPYIFGAVHLHIHEPIAKNEKHLSVALVQTNLLPTEKIPQMGRFDEYISPFVQWEKILKALKSKADIWDLIVLPEAVVPLQSEMTIYPFENVKNIVAKSLGTGVHFPNFKFPFAEEHFLNGQITLCVSNLFWCQTLSNFFNSEVIAGFDHVNLVNEKNYNSVFYLRPNSDQIQRYDKQVLLPLAEQLPFSFLKPWTKRYGIVSFFSQGEGAKVFGDKISFSPSICYEETFPEIMRSGRKKGAQLFVNVTNDNYFPSSSLHRQHLFHARVRAVENGIPQIRSCNAGISAAIDCFGRLFENNILFDSDGVLSCKINSYSFSALYVFWGDWGIISICLIICFFSISKNLLYYAFTPEARNGLN